MRDRHWILALLCSWGVLPRPVAPFGAAVVAPNRGTALRAAPGLRAFKVSAEELERGLSADEKSVVRVVREAGPLVAFVTSVWPAPDAGSQRRRRGSNGRGDPSSGLPDGRPLGSGSGFVVDARGYIVTNFHVIEQAWRLQLMAATVEELRRNYTFPFGLLPQRDAEAAQVYVSLQGSRTQFVKARIVDTNPELDIAVLFMEHTNGTMVSLDRALSFGSSSELLVGQNLIAIGNPFGLDTTVTTGIVSALNREIYTSSRRGGPATTPIRNCIQTDCAINPGNSGGPLLDARTGRVVGVNTAIVTTSGASAGIGFAVPADQVRPAVEAIVRRDVAGRSARGVARLGVRVLRWPPASPEGGAASRPWSKLQTKNWVAQVEPGSAAERAGMQALRLDESSASITGGQAIVAVGGNDVNDYESLQREMDSRTAGEQVSITVEDWSGERKVVYVTLDR